jgi:hypothetical protein
MYESGNWNQTPPCGGGVEYLHRDPASRRRRRNGKSEIWDCKIWSRVPRDSDPRKTALARASSIYKRQGRPLVREGAPQKQDRNCQTVINRLDTKTYWLTDCQSQCDFDFDLITGESWDGSWKSRKLVSDGCQSMRTWARAQRIVNCWKTLPSSAVKTVTEKTCRCVICKIWTRVVC